MLKRTLALLAAASLMGAGCWGSTSADIKAGGGTSGSAPVVNDGGTDVGSEIGATGSVDAAANVKIAGNWKLATFKKPMAGEKIQDVDSLNLTLTIGTDGKLSAKICNSMSGSYSYSGGKLMAPQIQSTLMFCPGLPGEIEAAFASDLAVGAAAQVGDGVLVLIGAKTLNVYTFAKR